MQRMIKISCFFLLIGIHSALFAGNEPDSIFQAANQLYQEGKYEEAVNLYLTIDSMDVEAASLYYNIGNAYFRSNKLGKARLYYERALLLRPFDEDLRSNLKYLESMLADRLDEVPEFFIKRWMRSFVHVIHSNTWAMMSLLSFLIFFLGGLAYIFSKTIRMKKTGFFVSVVFIILSLLFFGLGRKNYNQSVEPGTAIVMEESQLVKSSPRTSGKDLFILHSGTKVWLENSLDSWVEIRISDGRKGWVPVSSVEFI